MKKTYLAKRNALLSPGNVSWGTLALACAILALLLRLLAPNIFWQLFTPAFRVGDSIALASRTFLNGFNDIAALAAKNEQLQSENAALASENQALIEKEAQLKALLPTSHAASDVLAGVVARPPESPYDTLVVAAGSQDGIAPGYEAFGEGGVPLGVVSSVTSGFSRITLFSAPGAETHGWVGHNALPLTLLGAGAGAMTASLTRSARVAASDVVFVPGPGMLPIGSIARIESNPSSPGITLHIKSAVNPFSITWVLLRDTGAAVRDAFTAATSTP